MLICSGSLFSHWQIVHDQNMQAGSPHHVFYAELTALNAEICREQMPGAHELNWKPFSPDESYTRKAIQLLSSAQNEPQLAWADSNSSLLLNFWHRACEDARFVLFYSSPEYELANYICEFSFDSSTINDVIDAWVVRTRAMLTFFMNARGKCLLVDAESAMRDPGELLRTINEVLGAGLTIPAKGNNQISKKSVLHEYFAATLLASNSVVAELYDEIRSAATLLNKETPILRDIQARTELLIPGFLTKISQLEQLESDLKQSSDELTMMALQLHQTQKELEFYYLTERDTAALNEKYVAFLNQNPLLKLARIARLNEPSEARSSNMESQVGDGE